MQENNWNQQYQPPYGQQGSERKGFAIASLVLGILSIVLCCMYGAIFIRHSRSDFGDRFFGKA